MSREERSLVGEVSILELVCVHLLVYFPVSEARLPEWLMSEVYSGVRELINYSNFPAYARCLRPPAGFKYAACQAGRAAGPVVGPPGCRSCDRRTAAQGTIASLRASPAAARDPMGPTDARGGQGGRHRINVRNPGG